ncbi:MAG: DNA primase [Deltaproteobacteria bacterium]|nr:DNA primase [Deltaproteobacteria bacterium]
MKGHIPEDKIEEVKARVNVVDVVSEYVTLKKAGRNFIGLCPFHREKTPSFTVNPEKQIFYCFGCGEGGNAISFLMKINNMSFPESIRHLAGRMGITIPVKKVTEGERRKASEKETLIRINKMAADQFRHNLMSRIGEAARRYLEKRGIDDTVVKQFGLGYSPDEWRHLKNSFDGKGVAVDLVRKAGLIIIKDNGQSYDRFRGRLMFPIENLSGDTVAFGGRIIGDGEPKYLNSPESPIYIKGKILYGLYRTKNEIKRKDEAIIVEGYLDLFALWSAGIGNVVATLGTALTKEQIELVRRFTRNVSIIFDPDEAGKSAVERSLKLFLEEEIRARVVILPGGYDPDEYVRKYGRESLEELIARSSSMVDYYIEEIIGGGNTLEDKRDSVRDSVSFIGNISDPVQRNLFIKRVSEKVGIDQGILKDEVSKKLARHKSSSGQRVVPAKKREIVDQIELNLIHMIMEYPDRIPVVANNRIFDYFLSRPLKEIGESFIRSYHEGENKILAHVINDLTDQDIREKLLKLSVEERPYDDDIIDKILEDTVKKIRLRWYDMKRKSLQRELIKAQRTGDMQLCERLVMEKGRLLQEEKALKA